MKRKNKFIIAVVAILAVALGICIVIRWKTQYAKTEILTSTSDDNHHSLSVYNVGDPVMPYGDASCQFVLTEDGKKINTYSFTISNDGARGDESNFDVVWNDDDVTVTVTASEQNTRIYQLMFDGTVNWHE